MNKWLNNFLSQSFNCFVLTFKKVFIFTKPTFDKIFNNFDVNIVLKLRYYIQ